jgi:hypothetical protein
MSLQPHEQRVVDELSDLSLKIEKLNAFKDTFTWIGLSVNDQCLLLDQLRAMCSYQEILRKRIERFSKDPTELVVCWREHRATDTDPMAQRPAVVFRAVTRITRYGLQIPSIEGMQEIHTLTRGEVMRRFPEAIEV